MSGQANKAKQNRLLTLLIVAIIIAVLLYMFTGSGLLFEKVEKKPSDKQDNLSYGQSYTLSADNVLERDGIVLINCKDTVLARELSSGIEVEAGNIAERSALPITRIAEQISYLYMYDGETVYRLNIGGNGKLHTAVKSCLDFDVMGDYIYSLQEYKGQNRLYRCSLIGTNEKRIFTDAVKSFYCAGGNIIMLGYDDVYRWYNVVTQNSMTLALPQNITDLVPDDSGVLFLADGTLYRREYLAQSDETIFSGAAAFNAANSRAAILSNDGQVWLCSTSGEDMTKLPERSFPLDSKLDISSDYVFITLPSGEILCCTANSSAWETIYNPAE